MGLLGRGVPEVGIGEAPPLRERRPPKTWGTLEVESDCVVMRLSGWRAVWATRRVLRVPLAAVVDVRHDPDVYQNVSTHRRPPGVRRSASKLFRLGAQHGRSGWSFWACGLARNAVVIETQGVRYAFVIVEVGDPATVVETLRAAAGLPATPPRAVSPTTGPPGTWTPRSGAPRSGTPRSGTPRTGTPRTGAPRSGTPRSGAPRTGAPRTGSPRRPAAGDR